MEKAIRRSGLTAVIIGRTYCGRRERSALGISIFSTRAISRFYLEKPGDGNQFLFYTLPVVDGFMWSEGLDRAGLRIVRLDKDGDKEELTLDHPVVTEIGKDTFGSFRRRLKRPCFQDHLL